MFKLHSRYASQEASYHDKLIHQQTILFYLQNLLFHIQLMIYRNHLGKYLALKNEEVKEYEN